MGAPVLKGFEGLQPAGRFYGHLLAEHTQRAGKKVVFGVATANQNTSESPAQVDLTKINAADLIQLLQQFQSKGNGTPPATTSN